jgi:pyruvate formate lyase activating enzyme
MDAGQPGGSKAAGLRVGGLTRLTTIDYPGELAAVVFCQGCPWRCRYCQNGALLDTNGAGLIPWSDVLEFLRSRRGLLDAVVFSGGEPTLQAALPDAMAEVRRLGFRVGLHTGGAYPERLRRLLPMLDWVGLDIKAMPDDYPAVTGVAGSGTPAWESLRLLQDTGTRFEVRTTVMPGWTPKDLAPISAALRKAGVGHFVLQACDASHAIDPALSAAPRLPLAELARSVGAHDFASFALRGT